MSDDIPGEIQVVERIDGGVCYRLPRHRSGCGTAIGLVVLIFGLSMALFASVFSAVAVLSVHESLFGLLIAVVGLPFLALGIFVVLSGAWLAFGHTEVRLEAGKLAAVLKIGPIPYVVRRRDLTDVRRLAIISDGEQANPVLVAACQAAPPLDLSSLYPYEWLWHLGTDLAGRLNEARGEEDDPLELEEEWTDFTGDRPAQPVLSRVVVEELGEDCLVIRIPPTGWRDVSVFVVSTFAVAFVVAGVIFLVTPILGGGTRPLIAGSMLGIALIAILAAVEVARRRVVFEISGDSLTLRRSGLMTRTKSWGRDDIDAIRAIREQRKQVSHQGEVATTRWIWVTELQIHPATGRPVVLSGRYGMHHRTFEQEWEWLATKLREALDVSE